MADAKLVEAISAMKNQQPTESVKETAQEPEQKAEDKSNESYIGNSNESFTDIEQKAIEQGWRPREAYQGDSEDFVSAKSYLRYGQLQEATDKKLKDQQEATDRKLKEQQDLFNDQLTQLSKIKDAELQGKLKELQSQQRQAVSDADTERYDQVSKQIEDLNKTPKITTPSPQPNKPQVIKDWEAKHTWINDPSHPRTIRAQEAWKDYIYENPNATPTSALKYVEERLGLNTSNPMKKTAPITSTAGKRTSSSAPDNNLSWNGLSKEELRLWQVGGTRLWRGDKKAFLKAENSY